MERLYEKIAYYIAMPFAIISSVCLLWGMAGHHKTLFEWGMLLSLVPLSIASLPVLAILLFLVLVLSRTIKHFIQKRTRFISSDMKQLIILGLMLAVFWLFISSQDRKMNRKNDTQVEINERIGSTIKGDEANFLRYLGSGSEWNGETINFVSTGPHQFDVLMGTKKVSSVSRQDLEAYFPGRKNKAE